MLAYVVVEIPDHKAPYVYDSRKGKNVTFPEDVEGKRQLLIKYLTDEGIVDIISIQEYVIPDSRQQIICWYHFEPEEKAQRAQNLVS